MGDEGDLMRLARGAMRDKRPEAALAYWTQLRALTPRSTPVLVGLAKALMQLSRTEALMELADDVKAMDDVEARVLAIAFRRPAQNVKLSIAWCRAAESDGDDAEAILRWTTLRKSAPAHSAVHQGLAEALLRAGRVDDAERVASAAATACRRNAELGVLRATIAERRGDWREAALRWADVATRFRHYPGVRERLAAAEDLAGSAVAVPAAVGAADHESEAGRAAAREVLMRLENLGRTCELGLLQRHFGIEPMSLLRFSTTRPRVLIELLRSRFFGIGEPAHNEILLKKNEYRLRHKPTGLTSPRRMRQGDAEPDALLISACRHARYLRDKLIDDLEQQAKIFVYQKSDLDDATIRAIAAGLAAYGPNVLLCVRLCSLEKPAGTIEDWGEMVLVGYIDREGQEFEGSGWDISVGCWLELARAACARVDAVTGRAGGDVRASMARMA